VRERDADSDPRKICGASAQFAYIGLRPFTLGLRLLFRCEREANFSSEMMELLCEGLCCALFGLKSKCVAGAVCALFFDPQTLDVAALIISRHGFSKKIFRFSPLRFHSIDLESIFFIKATSHICSKPIKSIPFINQI
jgi:hypothetical protein